MQRLLQYGGYYSEHPNTLNSVPSSSFTLLAQSRVDNAKMTRRELLHAFYARSSISTSSSKLKMPIAQWIRSDLLTVTNRLSALPYGFWT